MKKLENHAATLGVAPFRFRLARYLVMRFHCTDNAMFWFLLHIIVQAGDGHLRTDLSRIGEEMRAWCGADSPLPNLIHTEKLVRHGLDAGLIGILHDVNATADSLPHPRPPFVLTADRNFLYILRRRRDEDHFLHRIRQRTEGQIRCSENPSPEKMLLDMLNSGAKFLILSGGPGTGKTSTVSRLLESLDQERAKNGQAPVQCILAAPTGRAAARMAEQIPQRNGRTLHSILGLFPGKPPRFNAKNPIDAELVIVDEASMVDLPLMNQLLDALHPDTPLILVGDPNQLPSVEAGTILGDLLAGAKDASHASGPLANLVIRLTTVYRSNMEVLNAANAVLEGNMENFMQSAVAMRSLANRDNVAQEIADMYKTSSREGRTFIALTPLRKGPWGVPKMNERISRIIGGNTTPFDGMPIVITHNDASRCLWNGERGVLRKTNGALKAVFPSIDGERIFPLAVLPGWEAAWVQTIHRSQGSEFNSVAVLLPEEAERLLSREILYTALTRAKSRIILYTANHTLSATLSRRIIRSSRIRQWVASD